MSLYATYSPEDNKLRLYSAFRLDKETYIEARKAGFIHAPKQGCFVAPMWTPNREDFLLGLCGEIGDEDTSLVDRAEQRADRFEGYSDNRLKDANQAHAAVKAIADMIPFGQPILVGHHSEARARRDQKRIENGMRKAVTMWDRSEYWKVRAVGALRHAKYKQQPSVRARRIKKLEAEKRKRQRDRDQAENFLIAYQDASAGTEMIAALLKTYEGGLSFEEQRQFTDGDLALDAALENAITHKQNVIVWCDRWLSHLANRLAYEKAMLEDQGASHLLTKAPRPKQPPLLNYRAPEGIDIENEYNPGSMIHYPMLEMTKAEYAAIPGDYKGGKKLKGHRIRIASACYLPPERRPEGVSRHSYGYVFLTDSKTHERPEG